HSFCHGQPIVIAVLITVVGIDSRFVGHRSRDLSWRFAPRFSIVGGELEHQVRLRPVLTGSRAVIDYPQSSRLLIYRKALVELVAAAGVGIDVRGLAPGEPRVGRAGKPEPGLAIGVDVICRLVGWRLTPVVTGEIQPSNIYVIVKRTNRDADQSGTASERRDA